MNRDQFFGRYGLSTWLYKNRSLEEALTRIAAAGFRQVEIWAWGAHLDPRLRPDLAQAKALVSRLGLRVHTLHAPSERALRIGDPNPSLRPGWMEAVGPCLEYAAELGARGVVVHVSTLGEALEPPAYAEGCRAVVEFVHQLRDRGRALGVRIILENMVDYGWPRFGTTLEELAGVFPEPDLGFCLDTGHAALNRRPIAREVAAAGSRLLSTHCSNNDGQKDDHNPPIQGVLDWGEVVAALDGVGYRYPLIMEIAGGEDPDAVLESLAGMWRET